ncbi:hypothetical protein HHL24_15600 [Paraburkholderia sp. RP-4-7]|uniref:Uncharacterized protein n=2 Tax=Paraburkholderia polaris TaxID=2728848 RepID=A0A848IAQ0_9BURK|nr:hypothetical protein [Paraburkholderia polaris]
MSLKFNDLLAKALAEWPPEIDFKPLLRIDPTSKRYSVSGLGEMADEIGDRYIGSTEEIFMRNLHWVIFEVLRDVAANVTRVKTSDLSPDAVRSGFERNLKRCMEMPDLGYPPAAIELGRRYFAENGGGGTE